MIADKTVDAEDENANATFTAGRWWTVQTRARHQTKRLCKLRALYSNAVSGLAGNNLQRAISAGDPQRRDRNYRAGKRALRIRTNSGRPDSEFLRAVIAERAGPGGGYRPHQVMHRGNRFVPVDKAIFRPAATIICSVRLTLGNRRYIAAFHGGQDAIKQLARGLT